MSESSTTQAGLPAILGGEPIFSERVPIVRPTLPRFEELSDELAEIVNTGMLTKGKHLAALEREVADHLEVKHAIAVSSCTSGLMLAYRCLGLGGEVVVPSFTFMATVSAMVWLGLRPVFADIDEQTANLDPAAVEAAISPRTSAIVAVHAFGNPSEIDALEKIAQQHGLKLVFDAAHGLGTLYRGKPVGSQGDAQVFSLSPTKLVVAGEGGIVTTQDDALAQRIRLAREYGMGPNYDSLLAGPNARLSEMHSLMARHSLAMLGDNVANRSRTVSLFHEQLSKIPGIGFQKVDARNRNSYKDYTITVAPDEFGTTRDALSQALAAENIDTRNYYDPPVHRQSAYRVFAPPEETLARTNRLSARCISLPLWSTMDDAMATGICGAIRRVHEFSGDVDARCKKSDG